MKKVLVSVLVSLAAVVVLPLSASAITPVVPKGDTDVTGTVTFNGAPVKGAKVAVVCNGNTKNVKTDKAGDYLAVFKAKNCPAGSSVNITATKNKETGVGSGTAAATNTKLNIAMVNVSVALPEMGFVTGSAAAVVAGGAVYTVRRRRVQEK